MDKQDLLLLKRSIKKDPRIKRLSLSFEELPMYNIPLKDNYEEVEQMHKVRKTRYLDRASTTFVQDIMEGMLDDAAKRARLSEILMGCSNTLRALNSTLDSLEGYLLIEYASKLRRISTKGERTSFIRHHVFDKYRKYSERVERVKYACEVVMSDIDKAGYTYTNIIKTVQLAAGRRDHV